MNENMVRPCSHANHVGKDKITADTRSEASEKGDVRSCSTSTIRLTALNAFFGLESNL